MTVPRKLSEVRRPFCGLIRIESGWGKLKEVENPRVETLLQRIKERRPELGPQLGDGRADLLEVIPMVKSQLHVGVGRTDLTPPLGTRLQGYAVEGRVAEKIADPLHSTALVLERDGLKVAWVSLDLAIVEDEEVEMIRAGVQAKTGIDPANVTVCSIQNHCAPATQSVFGWGDKDEAYVEAALPKIVDSVAKAATRLDAARLGIGTVHSDVGINRREILEDHSVTLGFNPWGAYDPEMTVLRFEGENGPIVTVVHYGAHPTAIGPEPVVSRDWPGVMIDRLEKITGAMTLFINGAVGDVAPRTNIHDVVGDGLPAAVEVGSRAATHALSAFNSVKEFRDVELAARTDEIFLPYSPLPTLEEARSEMALAEPHKDKWGGPMCNYFHWKAVLDAHSRPHLKGKTLAQTLTRLGPVVLVPFPGEPFAETVLRLRHYSPFQHTLCASTTNGSNGYFVTRESRHRGGYEVSVAKALGAYIFSENIDDVLVEENLRLLRRLLGDEHTAGPGRDLRLASASVRDPFGNHMRDK